MKWAMHEALAFDTRLLPRFQRIVFFRAPTDEELSASLAAYRSGDYARLVSVWGEVADPLRADLGWRRAGYERAHLLGKTILRQSFLATLRAVLAAGRHFFDHQLRAETAREIRRRFSYLERRHEHVPPGYTPHLRFPDPFVEFVDGDSVESAIVRFQIVAAMNEVQQHWYSRHLSDLFDLPELRTHAQREHDMALSYLDHFAPPASEELWRQCLIALDALNASVFEMTLVVQPLAFPARTMWHALSGADEWRSFVRAMSS